MRDETGDKSTTFYLFRLKGAFGISLRTVSIQMPGDVSLSQISRCSTGFRTAPRPAGFESIQTWWDPLGCYAVE